LLPDQLKYDSDTKTIYIRRERTPSEIFEYKYSIYNEQDVHSNIKHYILPYTKDSEHKAYLRIPSIYAVYLSVLSLCILYDKKDTYNSQVPLDVSIVSRDSGGKRRKDNYTFHFSIENLMGLVSYDEKEFSATHDYYGLCSVKFDKKPVLPKKYF
jgi:hypothetical protein